ncbi:MAG: DUF6786 family protein [Planctomycetota bacterium]
MKDILCFALGSGILLAAGCGRGETFSDDVAFMRRHTKIVVLSDPTGKAQVAVAPAYQGRVMTSTADGPRGMSFGWINRELIAAGEIRKHINVYGGEDRFWMGPEGGQFAIFFKKGSPFDLEHWQTPAVIDTEPFELVRQTNRSAAFQKQTRLTNYSGTTFELQIDRTVRVLSRAEVGAALGLSLPNAVKIVAYESDNRITNVGRRAWEKKTGLLSIWILGMFRPSPATTIVIPFKPGKVPELGPIVNDAYFGKVPPDRLVVKEDQGVLLFSGDGRRRSKIGLSPQRARSVAGSYDAISRTLTIVQYNKPKDAVDYVNSMWQLQEKPYAGDVINSYNDGPPAPGAKPLGPFYELETSSPAAALKPGESVRHVHRTIHLQGTESALSKIAQAVLGITVERIKTRVPRK